MAAGNHWAGVTTDRAQTLAPSRLPGRRAGAFVSRYPPEFVERLRFWVGTVDRDGDAPRGSSILGGWLRVLVLSDNRDDLKSASKIAAGGMREWPNRTVSKRVSTGFER